MSKVYRVGSHLTMSPITGISPVDGRWGGEIVDEYMEAIHYDVMNDDLQIILDIEGELTTEEIISRVVIQTILRTAQRLAVELDGCIIDTTTVFEDEPIEDNDNV